MEKDNHMHDKRGDKKRFNLKSLVLKILAISSLISFIYIFIIGDGDPESPIPSIILFGSLIFFLVLFSEDKIRDFLAKKEKSK